LNSDDRNAFPISEFRTTSRTGNSHHPMPISPFTRAPFRPH
jgi:hypothetical protein